MTKENTKTIEQRDAAQVAGTNKIYTDFIKHMQRDIQLNCEPLKNILCNFYDVFVGRCLNGDVETIDKLAGMLLNRGYIKEAQILYAISFRLGSADGLFHSADLFMATAEFDKAFELLEQGTMNGDIYCTCLLAFFASNIYADKGFQDRCQELLGNTALDSNVILETFSASLFLQNQLERKANASEEISVEVETIN